jgi:hypothetical protein
MMNNPGVLEKEPLFVIGFPKSGNTWLARMLAEVTDSNMNPRNPIDAADFSPARSGRYLIYKEHAVEDIDSMSSNKTVYIVRDVRDVLVSGFFHNNRWCNGGDIRRIRLFRWYFNHEIRKLNKMWRGNLWAEFVYRVKNTIKSVCGKNKTRARIGSWSSHVTFWATIPGMVVVRYEDLLNNPEFEMNRILRELQINVSDEVIHETVSNQSFAKKRSDFVNSGDTKNLKFMRKGVANGWKNLFSPAIAREIEKAHSPVMNQYGYVLEFYESYK